MKILPCMPWFMKLLLPLISYTLADTLLFSSTTTVKSELWLWLIRHCPVVLSELSVLWIVCFLLTLYRVNYRTVDMQYELMSPLVLCTSHTHTHRRSSLTDSLHQAAVSSVAAVCLVLAPIPLRYPSRGLCVVVFVA